MTSAVGSSIDPRTPGTVGAADLVPQTGRAQAFIERLVERVGGSASAATVYGTPVERAGVTVIPVARVRYGFGGGAGAGTGTGREGSAEAGTGEGAGAGGGVSATPVGYIEIKDGAATFHPIKVRDAAYRLTIVAMVLAVGFTAPRILKAVRS